MNFYPYFPHLLYHLVKIQYSAHNAVDYLYVHENQCCEGQSLLMGIQQNYIYTCTMKPYDILKVSNALVQSMYCVTKYAYTICKLVLLLTSTQQGRRRSE
jgi:hypothetical protein